MKAKRHKTEDYGGGKESLDFMLRVFDCYAWSIQTLDRRPRYFDVRYTDTDVEVDEVEKGRDGRSRQTAWLQGNAAKAKFIHVI